MNEKHYRGKLSGYINHELPPAERQALAEHLLQCADCRREHDEVKFGAALGARLERADAPAGLFCRRLAAAAILLIAGGLLWAVYFNSARENTGETARHEPPDQTVRIEPSTPAPEPAVKSGDQRSVAPAPSDEPLQAFDGRTIGRPQNTPRPNSQIPPAAKSPVGPRETAVARETAAAWKVETLAGTPTAGDRTIAGNGRLAVGDFLETDAGSRARIEVADIGDVEIAPNSRVRLVRTSAKEHRLSLERGVLQATILAPPRLFIVDTPSGAAVDLGCEYTLEVDAEGNSKLHVTSGFVALERDGRESIVPAGAFCLTKKGKGPGTPFAEDSSTELQKALYDFDFSSGGSTAVEAILREAGVGDALTLWHLLPKTEIADREKIFEALAATIKPPARVTKKGVLRLNRKMLDAWWKEIENAWFE
jgi:ferric-dicitrate binding protein FerR (iron transport regulator)